MKKYIDMVENLTYLYKYHPQDVLDELKTELKDFFQFLRNHGCPPPTKIRANDEDCAWVIWETDKKNEFIVVFELEEEISRIYFDPYLEVFTPILKVVDLYINMKGRFKSDDVLLGESWDE